MRCSALVVEDHARAGADRHRIAGIRTREQTQFVLSTRRVFRPATPRRSTNRSTQAVMGAVGDVGMILFVVEAGNFTLADAKVVSLFKPGIPYCLCREGALGPRSRFKMERNSL